MAVVLEPKSDDVGRMFFGIAVSQTNPLITERLLAGAQKALLDIGAVAQQCHVAWVPGSLELPLAIKAMAQSGRYHALVALGLVLRGETKHFELVAENTLLALMKVSQKAMLPVGYGVLACETLEQALDRVGGKHGNAGAQSALAAWHMACLMPSLRMD